MAAKPSTAPETTETAAPTPPNLWPTGMVGDLEGPSGVAVTEGGEIVVVESTGFPVTIISGKSYGDRRSFGEYGSDPGQFNRPQGIAIDNVADCQNNRIQQFSSAGKFLKTVGTRGSGPLQFLYPWGVAVHPGTGKVYVADCDNHRIQVLNSDLTYSSSFGTRGSNNGELNSPSDIAFDTEGNVYVADYDNNRIQVFTVDGVYLRQFGKEVVTNKPVSIVIDSQNVVYVGEFGNKCCVSLSSTDGELIKSFGHSENVAFYGPFGLAVDKNRTMYISETELDRVHVFNYFP